MSHDEKKSMSLIKRLFKLIFSRMVLVGLLLVLQVAVLVGGIAFLSSYFFYVYAFFWMLSLGVVIWLLSQKDNPSFKLAWTILILLLPVFGGLFYIICGVNRPTRKFARQMNDICKQTNPLMVQEPEILEELEAQDKEIALQSHYIADYASYPVYKNTETEYLSPGEVKFERLQEELQKAKHYIFLEYFIIEEGIMWNSVLDILREKAAQGLDVRVMYDDIGSIQTLPYKYDEKLRKMGIKAKVFNPFTPSLSIKMNNRDHRKIVVIDGHTGFTGGINLADEYINAYPKHGHWKDASIMIRGEAVWNLTVMFLQAWNFQQREDQDFEGFKPRIHWDDEFPDDGYVQPYGDSPMDGETVGESVYMNIINHARDYVYINTPYLIVDNELNTCLSLAAKNGIDVRIVTPHIPDKWYVHLLTRAYYKQLIRAGVKIYEYTPGFIHSKTFVSDDVLATVGTINLDFRSLYMHFECGVWMYKSQAVMQVKKDYLETLEVCQPITLEDCNRINLAQRFIRGLLRLFAPLM